MTNNTARQHVPAAGKASGLEGRALCGKWATYRTGDHESIRKAAREAVRTHESDHYCANCVRKLA